MGGASVLAPNFAPTLSGGTTGTVNGTVTAATNLVGRRRFHLREHRRPDEADRRPVHRNLCPVSDSYAEVATP